jgi:hypothetical protein
MLFSLRPLVTVAYLKRLVFVQACEHLRPDVTHVSLQLLPYPWFQRQHALFPGIVFPSIPRDASTDVTSVYVS